MSGVKLACERMLCITSHWGNSSSDHGETLTYACKSGYHHRGNTERREHKGLSYRLVGVQNGSAALENRLTDSYAMRHTFTLPTITLLGIYLKEMKIYIHAKLQRGCRVGGFHLELSENVGILCTCTLVLS